MKLASLIRSLKFRSRRRASAGAAFARVLLTGAVLLSQLQLAWLAGFHYHSELSISRRSPATIVSNRAQGSPADDGSSCPFCQVVRHSTSSPPSTVVIFFHSTSNPRITQPILRHPLAASHVRLAGRDPPLSLLANC
ncbi:MAG TPA: hypothetical protein VMT20_17985 [Terriglobia bacterium]|nr:hypothetical protein [Terriglobia bacterium]